MADKPLISPENQPTVIAVTFVLALLAFGTSVRNYVRTTQVARFLGGSTVQVTNASFQRIQALEEKVAGLEAKLEKSAAPADEPEAQPK